MNKKQKKNLYRIIAALVLVLILKLLPQFPTPVELLLYCIPYLVVGWDVLRKALLGIRNRQPFDECFLMAVATVGAFALGDYVEGCAVIIFYQIGELFQSVAVGKSRQSISSLMDIRPDYANVEDEDGKLNRSAVELGYSALVVSNFTLYGDTSRGKRPSFIHAARGELAVPCYEKFLEEMSHQGLKDLQHGEFGADMKIDLVNDGPVTIVIDTDEWKK